MNALKNIDWSPSEYLEAAVIANLAGEEMLNRLSLMTIEPQVILDMGCGPGSMIPRLRKRYPQASLLALDHSEAMITYTKQQTALATCICADGDKLPLRDHSVNLIFANLILPWCSNFHLSLKEWFRILHPEGVLMLSALGLDTFKEFNTHSPIKTPQCIDMHDLGDLMMQFGFMDPVLDVDHYSLIYNDKNHLIQELCASGVQDFPMTFEFDENLELTYEIIYAHGFGSSLTPSNLPKDNTVTIPLADMRKALKSSN